MATVLETAGHATSSVKPVLSLVPPFNSAPDPGPFQQRHFQSGQPLTEVPRDLSPEASGSHQVGSHYKHS